MNQSLVVAALALLCCAAAKDASASPQHTLTANVTGYLNSFDYEVQAGPGLALRVGIGTWIGPDSAGVRAPATLRYVMPVEAGALDVGAGVAFYDDHSQCRVMDADCPEQSGVRPELGLGYRLEHASGFTARAGVVAAWRAPSLILPEAAVGWRF